MAKLSNSSFLSKKDVVPRKEEILSFMSRTHWKGFIHRKTNSFLSFKNQTKHFQLALQVPIDMPITKHDHH